MLRAFSQRELYHSIGHHTLGRFHLLQQQPLGAMNGQCDLRVAVYRRRPVVERERDDGVDARLEHAAGADEGLDLSLADRYDAAIRFFGDDHAQVDGVTHFPLLTAAV